jgi:tRNA(fMet)-specific endonuclease VapC
LAVILDTNAISAAVAKDARLQQTLRSFGRPSIPLPAIGEYSFGLRGSTQADKLLLLFSTLVHRSIVLYPNLDTAEFYADIRHELKTKGRPVPENDIWIAALARQHSLPVATRDAHFDNIDGIQRINW